MTKILKKEMYCSSINQIFYSTVNNTSMTYFDNAICYMLYIVTLAVRGKLDVIKVKTIYQNITIYNNSCISSSGTVPANYSIPCLDRSGFVSQTRDNNQILIMTVLTYQFMQILDA